MEDKALEFLERQYKQAIDARDKLNDNFYKWMSYYYLANAGVLVAITTLYNKDNVINNGMLIFSFVGIIVCILWHLSCKGYYYWSLSWIDIIKRFEKSLIPEYEKEQLSENTKFAVYSIFSKEVAEENDFYWKPTSSANISTPKLTLLFSFISAIFWIICAIGLFINLPSFCICWKILIALFFIGLLIGFYCFIISKVKSRIPETQILVQCR